MRRKVGTAALLAGLMLISAGCGNSSSKTESSEITSALETAEENQTETISETAAGLGEGIQENSSEGIAQQETEAEVMEVKAESPEFENFKDNVIVVGDSIALGYGVYERLPLKNVYAKQSVSLTDIYDTKFDSYGIEAPALDILGELQPENIMLSLGINDIISYSAEDFTDMYREFADKVLERTPVSQIYIMGLSPVVANCTYVKNDKVNDYNDTMAKFFKDYNKQIHFVNAAAVLKDSKGCLDSRYSSGDGIHLTGEAYDMILDEMQNQLF